MAFHDQGKEDYFITFFTTEMKTFYLNFACDWMPGNPVRLERIQLKELKSYFERNNTGIYGFTIIPLSAIIQNWICHLYWKSQRSDVLFLFG